MCLNKLFQILGSWYRPLSLTWVFPESDSLGVATVLRRFDNSRFPDTNSMPCSPTQSGIIMIAQGFIQDSRVCGNPTTTIYA